MDPSQELDGTMDLLVAEGKVAVLAPYLDPGEAQCIDLSGKVIVPGFVDIHVHLREPGFPAKENIVSGCAAAAAGGITSLAVMPNTRPSLDSSELVELIRQKGEKSGLARIYPVAALTRGRQGMEAADFASLYQSGVRAFSDDGSPVADSALFLHILNLLASYEDAVVISHSEDLTLSAGGAMHEGYWSRKLGLPGIPAVAETVAVARDILLAEASGARLHLAHISTAGAVEWISWAKSRNMPVTAEVTPQHLLLTDAAVNRCGAVAKVNPPLRTEEDRLALCRALKRGIIDIIATDHAPHELEEKQLSVNEAPFGITGLETAVPLLISNLVQEGPLTLPDLVEAYSCRPARLLGLPGGTLRPGAPADLAVLDMEACGVVQPERFYSKARYSPFAGYNFKGAPVMTMLGGIIIMKEGELILEQKN